MADSDFTEIGAQSEFFIDHSSTLEDTFEEITRQIVRALEESPTVHRIGETPLPNTQDINEILEHLFEATSPGYGRNQNLKRWHAPFQIGDRVSEVYKKLVSQGTLDLRSNPKWKEKSTKELRVEASLMAVAFLNLIPSLIKRLEEDLAASFHNDPAAKSLELILLCYPGVEAVRIHRIAHALHELGFILIPRIMAEIAHRRTGIDIHPAACVGLRFFIDHGTGVVIGETSTIGNDVVLYQGITVGARKFPRNEHGHVRHDEIKRHPTIGNGVVVYANSTILGGDTLIGDKTVIGASTWIEESVGSGKLVTIEKPNQRYMDVPAKPLPPVVLPKAKAMTEEDRYHMFLDSINRCDDN